MAIAAGVALARLPPLRAVPFLLLLAAWPAAAQDARPDVPPLVELPPVVVIDSTPVPALGTPVEKYAGNVQSVTSTDPGAFVADPALKPVVARTCELGARGSLRAGDALRWSLAFFRTDLQDDILFTQTATTGTGFFRDVERTRRQGVEAGLQGSAWKRLRYYLSYGLVDATYQTSVTLASVTEVDGVAVKPWDRIPGIPLHNIKVGAELALLDNVWIGGNVVSASGNYLRGDDGNRQAKVAGYTVLNLNVRYVPVKRVEIWGRVDNATNAHYATAGALSWNAFADPIGVQRFAAPGAPIGGWADVKVRF